MVLMERKEENRDRGEGGWHWPLLVLSSDQVLEVSVSWGLSDQVIWSVPWTCASAFLAGVNERRVRGCEKRKERHARMKRA